MAPRAKPAVHHAQKMSVELASPLGAHGNDDSTHSGSEEAESRPLSASQREPTEALTGASRLHGAMGPVAWFGYLSQYFAVGLIYGGLPSTVYGVFNGYLNVPAHVFATISTVMTLPWSMKFAFGLVNDCFPILGYHRKPYMVIGWSFCAATLLYIAWCAPLPEQPTGAAARWQHPAAANSSSGGGAAEPCMLRRPGRRTVRAAHDARRPHVVPAPTHPYPCPYPYPHPYPRPQPQP